MEHFDRVKILFIQKIIELLLWNFNHLIGELISKLQWEASFFVKKIWVKEYFCIIFGLCLRSHDNYKSVY